MKKVVACTSLFWIAAGAIAYSVVITKQMLVVPDHSGYVEVRQGASVAIPEAYNVHERQDALGDLIHKVVQEQ